jgi:hypothetical protein
MGNPWENPWKNPCCLEKPGKNTKQSQDQDEWATWGWRIWTYLNIKMGNFLCWADHCWHLCIFPHLSAGIEQSKALASPI